MISTIDIHEYQLIPKKPLNPRDLGLRRGALLKITFDDQMVGYSDLFAWEELGDLPLNIQLQRQDTPQFFQSVHFARRDAVARKEKISLFKGLKIPKSHNYLKGVVKKKMGFDLKKEISFLKEYPDTLWRLDFNEILSQKEFETLLPQFEGLKIDFFEDPFPFDPLSWSRLTLQGVPLASDRAVLKALKNPDAVSVFVVKPALFPPSAFMNQGKRVVITSYMDHPIGQLFAALEAANYSEFIDMPGLLTHTFYEETLFSKALKVENDVLIPPEGTGIGFDALLNALNWSPL